MKSIKDALLWDKITILGDEKIRCRLCAHYCIVSDGELGKCLTRKNNNGTFEQFTYGNISGFQSDPIEKKPLYHYKPGSKVISFGTPGCNFKCLNCQNWRLSQAFSLNSALVMNINRINPNDVVRELIDSGTDGIAFTYSEPTIFLEYISDIMRIIRGNSYSQHLFSVFVSNGYFSSEALSFIIENNLLDAINIDFKFSSEKNYQRICGASIRPVINSIKFFNQYKDQIHLEVTNLLIPGENDSDNDILQLCELLATISTDIPLHFSRFNPQYQMSDKAQTRIDTMLMAYEIANGCGIKYVYLGNINQKGFSDTVCPECNNLLIRRSAYYPETVGLIISETKPKCNKCMAEIPLVL